MNLLKEENKRWKKRKFKGIILTIYIIIIVVVIIVIIIIIVIYTINIIRQLKDTIADQHRETVKKKINTWLYRHNTMKHISELLNTMATIATFIPPLSITKTKLDGSSSLEEIKKAYLKAVRFVHPDKISSDIDLDQQLLAQEMFIVLSESYENFRSSREN